MNIKEKEKMKVVLSIAGSDSSGGAGIQADLKTFEAFGLFGTSVISILTAQNTQGVTDIYEVNPSFVKSQIEAVLKDFDIGAIKVGMLYSNEIIDVVRESISKLDIPIVVDPVFISKAGSTLLHDDAVDNLKTLFPYATLITPNRFEAEALFDYDRDTAKAREALYHTPYRVLVKHETIAIDNRYYSIDTLYETHEKTLFKTPLLSSHHTHGTGCSFSSAIAANLALGKPLKEAIAVSKNFIYHGIQNAPDIGHGKGPIGHKKATMLLQESEVSYSTHKVGEDVC